MRFEILIVLILLKTSSTCGQVSVKDIDLEYGRFSVGFQHYLSFDSTRTYQRIFDWNNQRILRPIPVSIWYPSNDKVEDLQKMTVLDYMVILKDEEEWEYLPAKQILNWFYYPNTEENRRHLQEETMACSGISVADGSFPVIIYAPSYQASSIENFALCAYLASHGYMVISSPCRGTDNRFLEGGTASDMETQARDIEFLIKEAAKFPNTEYNKIATMGFSFGGLSNVLAQMQNDNIKAIASLDGSIRYNYKTLKESPFADINKADVPFIHMAQKDIPEQVLEEDNIDPELNYKFEFYDSLKYSMAYRMKFHNLTHSYFSTLGILFQPRDLRQDKSDAEIMESYKWISKYTLNFLNAYLKDENEALTFLKNKPEQNGVKSGLVSIKSKKPENKPFTFQDFNELATEQNYLNLGELYKNLSETYPSLELAEGKLNNLGLQLIFNPETSANAIRVFHLATTIYPDSANLFDSLAEAYLYVGNTEKAIENFEKSLELNAENRNAANRLMELRK